MKLGIISDHRGYNLKEQIKPYLKNFEVIDYGTDSTESIDYPDFAFKLGEAVVSKEVDLGIAICGSGIGMSIACNKVKGIRCARVTNTEDVKVTRNDNDANIIAFGENIPLQDALNIISTFVNTPCSMDERHVRRRNKLSSYEENR